MSTSFSQQHTVEPAVWGFTACFSWALEKVPPPSPQGWTPGPCSQVRNRDPSLL